MENQAAIQVAKQTGPTKKRKYIDLRRHYLHHHIKHGNIILHHVPSGQMLADPFTRPLKPPFRRIVGGLNIPQYPVRHSLHDCFATGECYLTHNSIVATWSASMSNFHYLLTYT